MEHLSTYMEPWNSPVCCNSDTTRFLPFKMLRFAMKLPLSP